MSSVIVLHTTSRIKIFCFQEFREDGEFVIVYIVTIFSPNEFYVWLAKNTPDDMKEYNDMNHRLKLV